MRSVAKKTNSRADKKKNNRSVYTIFILLCAVVFLFALYKIVGIMMDYKAIEDYYKGANDDFVTESNGLISDVDLDKLIEINDDVRGWIYIKGMDISYPIVQGKTNKTYLFKNYEKNYLVAGSIFMDSANTGDFDDSHTIIYGHNMHNGSMFGQLDKFMEEAFRDEHPYVYVMLPNGLWNKYEIFSSYIANLDDGTFKVFRENEGEYKKYVELADTKNLYKNTSMPTGQKILTLSTCTEDSNDYKRYVLQAAFVGTVTTP